MRIGSNLESSTVDNAKDQEKAPSHNGQELCKHGESGSTIAGELMGVSKLQAFFIFITC